MGCASGPPPAAPLDPATTACAHCRMMVSERRFASQLVGPAEEPKFFDDLGCLRGYLAEHPPPASAVVYVTDHRTGAWVPASTAVFTRLPALETPMGSHLVAHADQASRAADSAAQAGAPVDPRELFGARGAPGRSP
jgi:copper chaperone NosL